MPPAPNLAGLSCATGFGLMGMTWREVHAPDEQAFAAMSAAIANGAVLWSTAEFYGTPDPTAGLQLLRRYFEAHPENASKVTLFVKGCVDLHTLAPRTTRDDVRKSAENCLAVLGGAKAIDIFGPARANASVPLSETLGALGELVKEGKIGAVGLSEVGAATLEKAHALHPISMTEVEFSLWCTDILTNGVAAAAKRLGVAIAAYSPLGRGFLTGQIRSPSDIPGGDFRHHLDRFQGENLDKNSALVRRIQEVADAKKVTPAQLALAWVRAASGSEQAGAIIPIPGATTAARVEENTKSVALSDEEKAQIDAIVSSATVHGKRYNAALEGTLWG